MAAIPPQFLKNAKAPAAADAAPAAPAGKSLPPWLNKGPAKLDPKRKKKARAAAIADMAAKPAADAPKGGSQPPWLKGK